MPTPASNLPEFLVDDITLSAAEHVVSRVGCRCLSKRVKKIPNSRIVKSDPGTLVAGQPSIFNSPTAQGWHKPQNDSGPHASNRNKELCRILSLGFRLFLFAFSIPRDSDFLIFYLDNKDDTRGAFKSLKNLRFALISWYFDIRTLIKCKV